MSTIYPKAKSMVSVGPVNWLPGSLTGALPFFSVQNGVLYFRADDPNLYGIIFQGGLMSLPSVAVKTVGSTNPRIRLGNKGYNFYSAPWCIPTLPCRDTGKRVEITSIDPTIFTYITSFYKNLTGSTVNLQNFSLEDSGYAKQYQVVYGNQYNNVNGKLIFGGTKSSNPGMGGVNTVSSIVSPNISITQPYTYDDLVNPITTYQQPYNTFYAIDTPMTISAVDDTGNRLYFVLQNPVSVFNAPNFSQ
jgi:hypothetical protein